MTYTYIPQGVCARKIQVEIENGIIKGASFTGGCNGNTQGICKLVIGMSAEDAIEKLEGIDCRGRGTSCPDQLANALKEALELD